MRNPTLPPPDALTALRGPIVIDGDAMHISFSDRGIGPCDDDHSEGARTPNLPPDHVLAALRQPRFLRAWMLRKARQS